MSSVGLMPRWGHRVTLVAGQGEPRLEPAENEAGANPMTHVLREDEALAAGCRAGELRAYERLYELQGARMRNLARNLLGSQNDAEDAVQDTFLKIQRGIGSFRGQSSFQTWTFRILVNTCHDLRRSRMRRNEQVRKEREDGPPALEPRAPGASPSLRLALEQALAQLTEHQRDVFLLYEVEGFRHAEIAGLLEISEAASKNTLFQAKKNLRRVLGTPRGVEAGGAP